VHEQNRNANLVQFETPRREGCDVIINNAVSLLPDSFANSAEHEIGKGSCDWELSKFPFSLSSIPAEFTCVAIPSSNSSGLLPKGIYQCTLDELRARFGSFQGSDIRLRLMQKLESFLQELRSAGIVRALIVDGSFVTTKMAPNDIDLLIVLPTGHDFRADLPLAQYKVVDSRRVKRVYGLDVFVVEEGSADYAALIQLFHRVRLQPRLTKGILRIEL
jgi:hypothetical protein